MKKTNNILGVDRGSKYIGLSYVSEDNDVIMPIGSLMNDGSLFFNLGDIFPRYNIKKVVIGWPSKEEEIQQKIDNFITQIGFIAFEKLEVIKVEEDYTSVEAGAVTGDFKKNASEDMVASMKILERYKDMMKGGIEG